MQDFYLNQNQVIFKHNFVSKLGLCIKTMNKFSGNLRRAQCSSSRCQGGFASLLPFFFSPSVRLISLSRIFFHPRFSLLVVALESLRHEQLPEVLRSEFLHVLAVVVDLPCNKQCVHAWWRLGGLEHFADVLLRQRGL